MTVHATLETAKKTDGSPHLRFSVHGQQFLETIQIVENGMAVNYLTSLRDSDSTAWPASPPWQELHVHEQPDGARILLLVGRAGRSHWSMSVSVDDAASAIIFDVACRIHESPDFLGSTYRNVSRTELQSVQVEALRLDGLQICPTPIESREDQIVIRADSDVQPPATVRWKYRISLSEITS